MHVYTSPYIHPLSHARTNATFSSFFFHNGQWTSYKSTITRGPHSLHLTVHPAPQSLPRSAYKPVDALSTSRLLKVYSELSKARLSILNVLAVMSGMALSPLPTTVPILLSTAVGTAFCCASANTLNQLQEVPFDAQMARTRNRPLVRRAITPFHATGFAIATGIAGPVVLWTMTNPATAILGASNILLYAGAYTWMKRKSIWNTWVGAVVGAVPALMGWTASGGHLLPSPSYPVHFFLPPFLTTPTDFPLDLSMIDNPLAPFAFFMLMFSWQFPHFNGLSHAVRGSYAQAGYRMLSVLDPNKNALVSLRHAVLLTSTCSILIPLSGLTTWWFALTSLPANLICLEAAWRFWKEGGDKQAMKVFRHSLWYLPVILGLMMFHKQGIAWPVQSSLGSDSPDGSSKEENQKEKEV
ncbi:protoheme IX farnesyltransferase [Dendrothele bispora CBS 962.96]|uniref:Protoheme IX farnesyltransferase, mitochondrial n=1 Tax=Dendrothele bispora (strain CBS 962.96) TaxID=1314807 RepID=A0A4S8MX15_DENBC|nr:protoheme IX farnesyltransferase [Dendrothele bispora CBS 962.96]